MKYFCISEAVALYLQNLLHIEKKIFFGNQNIHDLIDVLKKHKSENILLPCTDILRDVIPNTLTENNIQFTKSILWGNAADLSDLEMFFMTCWFSSVQVE